MAVLATCLVGNFKRLVSSAFNAETKLCGKALSRFPKAGILRRGSGTSSDSWGFANRPASALILLFRGSMTTPIGPPHRSNLGGYLLRRGYLVDYAGCSRIQGLPWMHLL
jgi:hypothetical protein